jgi:hypothetical protein
LDEEYNPVFTAIVARANPISPSELNAQLLSFSSILLSKPLHLREDLHQLFLHHAVVGTRVITAMVAARAVVAHHATVFPPSLDVALVATPQDHNVRRV